MRLTSSPSFAPGRRPSGSRAAARAVHRPSLIPTRSGVLQRLWWLLTRS